MSAAGAAVHQQQEGGAGDRLFCLHQGVGAQDAWAAVLCRSHCECLGRGSLLHTHSPVSQSQCGGVA
jgi:hypothetical protein